MVMLLGGSAELGLKEKYLKPRAMGVLRPHQFFVVDVAQQ